MQHRSRMRPLISQSQGLCCFGILQQCKSDRDSAAIGRYKSGFVAVIPTVDRYCSSEDLLVFMEMIYLPRHAGSILPDGTCIVAPSTIGNVLSHLRTTFKKLDRGDQWNDHGRAGNPAASNHVHA